MVAAGSPVALLTAAASVLLYGFLALPRPSAAGILITEAYFFAPLAISLRRLDAWNAFLSGVAGIIGPRIGGVLYDKYKDYQAAFYTAAVLAVVALVAELIAKRPEVPAEAKVKAMA